MTYVMDFLCAAFIIIGGMEVILLIVNVLRRKNGHT